MKAIPVKGGHGHITAYKLTIGSAAARRCGFIGENGERYELESIEKPECNSIVIKVKEKQEPV